MIQTNGSIAPAVCGRNIVISEPDVILQGGLRTKGILKESRANLPLLTYITVVYNRENTIRACIESVLQQPYENIEYIVIDGASTDRTTEILLEYADRIDYFVSQKDAGIYDAMNKGLSLSRGEYICFMNSDDICTPNASAIAMRQIMESGADMLCGGRVLKRDAQVLPEHLYVRYPVHHCVFRYIQLFHQATYAKRELFEKLGGFSTEYSLISDWVWQSNVIDHNYSVRTIPDKLTVFDYGGASFTGIIKRDEEWIRWVQRTFSSLSYQDAEFFLFCMDRDRHPMISFSTLYKKAVTYGEDLEFQKTFYETCLLICLEACEDILRCLPGEELAIAERWNRYKKRRAAPQIEWSEVQDWLLNRLNASCRQECICYSIDDNADYSALSIIRDFQTHILCRGRQAYKQNEAIRNPILRFFSSLNYLMSYIVGKSVSASAAFYRRNRKYLEHI